MAPTRRGGTVSVPGVYAGFVHSFLFGDAFEKGLTFKSGQTHAQHYMPELLEHLSTGRLKPEVIITRTGCPLRRFRRARGASRRCVIRESRRSNFGRRFSAC